MGSWTILLQGTSARWSERSALPGQVTIGGSQGKSPPHFHATLPVTILWQCGRSVLNRPPATRFDELFARGANWSPPLSAVMFVPLERPEEFRRSFLDQRGNLARKSLAWITVAVEDEQQVIV